MRTLIEDTLSLAHYVMLTVCVYAAYVMLADALGTGLSAYLSVLAQLGIPGTVGSAVVRQDGRRKGSDHERTDRRSLRRHA